VNLFDVFIIVLLPLLAITAAVVFGVVLPRMQRQRRLRGPIPVALGHDSDVIPPRPERPLATLRPSPPVMQAVPQTMPPQPVYAPPVYQAPPPPPTPSAPSQQIQFATGTDGGAPPPTEARASASIETPHLRLATTPSDVPTRAEARLSRGRRERTLEGTLQFLPGRLEIVDGRDVGQEVRFVRQPGEDTTVVTFGRSEGVPYRHVQLHEPTVSRVHASLSLEGKRWRLTNLSKTNPVVVNGQPLEGEDASMVLTEGDRVEMGEVVFKFRAK
jgi:hypothetical protein